MNIKISFSELYSLVKSTTDERIFCLSCRADVRWKQKCICAEKGVVVNVSMQYLDEMSI